MKKISNLISNGLIQKSLKPDPEQNRAAAKKGPDQRLVRIRTIFPIGFAPTQFSPKNLSILFGPTPLILKLRETSTIAGSLSKHRQLAQSGLSYTGTAQTPYHREAVMRRKS